MSRAPLFAARGAPRGTGPLHVVAGESGGTLSLRCGAEPIPRHEVAARLGKPRGHDVPCLRCLGLRLGDDPTDAIVAVMAEAASRRP
jgi:hypothetical protein